MLVRLRPFTRACAAALLWLAVAGPAGAAMPAASSAVSSPEKPAGSELHLSALPLRRDAADDAFSLQGIAWAIVLLSIFAVGAVVVARRSGTRGGGLRWPMKASPDAGTPRLAGRAVLSPQAQVCNVKWGDEELLIGVTAQSLTLLARRTAEATPGHQPAIEAVATGPA